jgi:phospholipid/cholesterol/gamma-HCH transport system substrate-binding protein
MKFTVRFADQVVGGFIILAIGAIIFVIFMLGSSQRWFSKQYNYKTYFTSAGGLSKNMPVQYRGFTIGHVKTFDLADDDRVIVQFYIFDTYISRVREGSLVEIMVSPINLGNQFLFHPGLGTDQIAEGELIPSVTSSEGRQAILSGLASVPVHDDSISLILNRLSTVLDSANATLNDISSLSLEVQYALAGEQETSLGRTMGGIEEAVDGLQTMAQALPATLDESLKSIVNQISPILVNLDELSGKLNNPDGTVSSILDSSGPVYSNLVSALEGVAGTLQNLEKTTAYLPAQMPQIAVVVSDLRAILGSAQDVLTALTNNPLLKNGIPERIESHSSGTSTRDISF